MAEASEGQGRAFRRRVFYIPGYDPFHPRRYRELYRKEGAAQAALSGYALTLKPKRARGPYGWRVEALIDGKTAEVDVEVLVWSDIVKGSMGGGIAQTYWQLLQTAWTYLASGALVRLMRLRKGPVIAALYPVALLLVQLAVAAFAGWIVWQAVAWAMPGLDGRGLIVHAVLALVAATAALRGFRRLDNRLMAYYLMHDYAFSARWGGANPPALEARMVDFRQTIATALTAEWDEVLVVGHSSGAHLAVSILADLVRQGLPDGHPTLSFLSLGHVVPMVSFLPRADRLRADLHFLSARDEITWVDVTAPGDGCAFALCDPVAVTGVAPEGKLWPLVLSAAFTQTLRPATWKALRWRFFRLHFQYLCAFDALPGNAADYDFFRITAGTQTLRQRFANRPASKSRIERATSGFTSMAA